MSQPPTCLDMALLTDCPFLLLKEGDLVHTIGDQILEESRIHPVVSAYAEHLDTLYTLCEAGLGAMFCPKMYLSELHPDAAPGVHCFQLPNPLARYAVNLSYPANAYKNTALHAFLLAAKTFGDAM